MDIKCGLQSDPPSAKCLMWVDPLMVCILYGTWMWLCSLDGVQEYKETNICYSQHTLGLTGWLSAGPEQTRLSSYGTWLGYCSVRGKLIVKSLKNDSGIRYGDSQ